MKAYLLLDNGFKIDGNLFGHSSNMFGELSLSENGAFVLKCKGTSSECILSESSASIKKGNSAFFSADIHAASLMLNDVNPTYAKIVIDNIGIDYHLYDLKTFIPGINLSSTKKNAQKEAA